MPKDAPSLVKLVILYCWVPELIPSLSLRDLCRVISEKGQNLLICILQQGQYQFGREHVNNQGLFSIAELM